ncbi:MULTISPECIES: hypothetical protein [Acinetobacter calcoaceticus/baumannii complex]|jgi:predicted HicB family RNase H-like nuclease|uniref:hypothetical protein n=1 Tax=Acinetobacter calcoaceticus/baumannii complex TaxID=909768 RepID=UPI000D655BD9|nr:MULTISPECIES: hypothetical protein [Acinetobacter calcoaceticus/baumannii complex]MBO1280802.1 hypothetical protein [Acinetobacter nosocomialis]
MADPKTGRAVSQDDWKRTQVRMPQEQYQAIMEYAEKNNLSLNTAMIELMDKGLNGQTNINLEDYLEEIAERMVEQTRRTSLQSLLPHTDINALTYNATEEFAAVRYKISNTTDNCINLIQYLDMSNCLQVILFATSKIADESFSYNDGPDNNLPLMGALALVELPTLTAYVVFDGLFLTAARLNRYREVKDVLDHAIESKKALFITEPVPFTSSLSPIDALEKLANFKRKQLTVDSRREFFRLLSNLSEQQLLDL